METSVKNSFSSYVYLTEISEESLKMFIAPSVRTSTSMLLPWVYGNCLKEKK
jgi:hypothetical protein